MPIWSQESTWPKDFESFIFLARAVRLVGRATFPDHWNDTDLLQEPEPKYRDRSLEVVRRRHGLMRQLLKQDDPRWKVPDFPRIAPPGANLPVEDWRRRGEQLLREHEAMTDAAYARCRQVEQMLLDWLVASEVRAALRPHEGGALQPIPNTHWNSENVVSRFATCKLDADNPFKPISDIQDSSATWIFVNVADLTRQLPSTQALTDVPTAELRRSTILRFAIDFSEEHFDSFFVKGRTQKEISNQASKAWLERYNSILPNKAADAIAIIVREIAHGKGKWSPVHRGAASKPK